MVYFDEDPQKDLEKALEHLVENAPRPLALSQRKKIAKNIPWVNYHAEEHDCEGWHAASHGKLACKFKAHWRYRFTWFLGHKKDPKYLCWKHLIQEGIYGTMTEEERFNKWLNKRYPKLKDIP